MTFYEATSRESLTALSRIVNSFGGASAVGKWQGFLRFIFRGER